MVKKAAKATTKKSTAKEEFQPTKMTIAISALAATSLLLLAVIAVYST